MSGNLARGALRVSQGTRAKLRMQFSSDSLTGPSRVCVPCATVNSYRTLVVLATVLAASSTSLAQSSGSRAVEDDENPTRRPTAAAEGPAESSTGVTIPDGWPVISGEKHLMARITGGGAIRLLDPWGSGAFAPPWMLVQGSFLFGAGGPVRLGLSVGGQLGFDQGRSGMQYALQPGLVALIRPSGSIGLLARLDVPILFTRGQNTIEQLGSGTDGLTGHSPIRYPADRPIVATMGFELGLGATYFITSGFGIVLEVNTSLYLGDSGFSYPLLGGGLGLVVDYELLP
jgi:hypothetical protein